MSPTYREFHRVRQLLPVLIIAMLSLSCILPQMMAGEQKADPTPSLPSPTEMVQPTPTRQATPAPTQTPTDSADTNQIEVLEFLYRQDFSAVPADWDLSPYHDEAVEVAYGVEDGVFSWAVQAAADSVVMKKPDPAIFLPEDGFLISVATQIQSVDSPSASGIIFRMQDFENFYFAKLSDTGEVSAYALQDNRWSKLAGPVKSDHFVAGKLNRLSVVDQHGQYVLQINDYPTLNFSDDRFLGGSSGLIAECNAGTKATVLFDDFDVMKPGGSPARVDEEENTIPEEGGVVLKYEGEIKGVGYSIDYPANFIPTSAGGVDRLCLEKDEQVCVSVRRPDGIWDGPEAMSKDVMAGLRNEVTDLEILHEQHTTTTDGFTAYWVGCTYTRAGVAYESSRLFVMIQQVSFEVEGYAPADQMETYAPVIKRMIESFTIAYN